MNDLLTMDRSGRLVLPKRVRQLLHLGSEARFRVEVAGNRVELILVDEGGLQLKKKQGLLVVPKKGKPVNAVEGIDEVRRERS